MSEVRSLRPGDTSDERVALKTVMSNVSDAVWGTPTGAQVQITSGGAELPAITEGSLFSVINHSNPANNGLYREDGGAPTTLAITASKIVGSNPVASGIEPVDFSTDTASANPLVTENGMHLQGAEYLHIYADLGGTLSSVDVSPWFWSDAAEQWFQGAQITFSFAADARFALVETQGENRVYFVVDDVVGAGTFKLWAGYSFTDPGRDG